MDFLDIYASYGVDGIAYEAWIDENYYDTRFFEDYDGIIAFESEGDDSSNGEGVNPNTGSADGKSGDAKKLPLRERIKLRIANWAKKMAARCQKKIMMHRSKGNKRRVSIYTFFRTKFLNLYRRLSGRSISDQDINKAQKESEQLKTDLAKVEAEDNQTTAVGPARKLNNDNGGHYEFEPNQRAKGITGPGPLTKTTPPPKSDEKSQDTASYYREHRAELEDAVERKVEPLSQRYLNDPHDKSIVAAAHTMLKNIMTYNGKITKNTISKMANSIGARLLHSGVMKESEAYSGDLEKTKKFMQRFLRELTSAVCSVVGLPLQSLESFMDDLLSSTLDVEAAFEYYNDVMGIANEGSFFKKQKPVEKLLVSTRKMVNRKCKTVEDCNDYLAKLKTEQNKFNGAIKVLQGAAKKYAADKDKAALRSTTKPVLTGLKKDCEILKLSNFVGDTSNIGKEEISRLHDYIVGAKRIINERKKVLSSQTAAKESFDLEFESFLNKGIESYENDSEFSDLFGLPEDWEFELDNEEYNDEAYESYDDSEYYDDDNDSDLFDFDPYDESDDEYDYSNESFDTYTGEDFDTALEYFFED